MVVVQPGQKCAAAPVDDVGSIDGVATEIRADAADTRTIAEDVDSAAIDLDIPE
ncbi:MAG: hypothetical protein AB7R89_31810 [Dehalococcoidia bacterium]